MEGLDLGIYGGLKTESWKCSRCNVLAPSQGWLGGRKQKRCCPNIRNHKFIAQKSFARWEDIRSSYEYRLRCCRDLSADLHSFSRASMDAEWDPSVSVDSTSASGRLWVSGSRGFCSRKVKNNVTAATQVATMQMILCSRNTVHSDF